MVSTTFKVKVLAAYGMLLSLLLAGYAPEYAKPVLTFALCVIIAVVLFNAEHIVRDVTQFIRARAKASRPQAVKLKDAPTIDWCSHVDYDNYFIPTYLRRQEVTK